MRRKYKSILGSKRSSYFRAESSTPVKFRPQRVRFRKKYATSVLSSVGSQILTGVKIILGFGIALGLAYQGKSFWENSSWLKISNVQFSRIPPKGLPEFLALKPGQNIFKFSARDLESASLSKFKDLKSISISRGLSRQVITTIEYRKPLAWMDLSGRKMAIDEQGIVFPFPQDVLSGPNPPELIGFSAGTELFSTMRGLSTIFNEIPEFYSLIKFVKTDRMQPLRIGLRNESVIYWGEFNSTTVVGRAKKVQQFFQKYEPKRPLASLRFVTDDRIVMDSQWKVKK